MEISYVLLNAFGMGGTIRTVIAQANAMAARGHRVEIVSVLRRRQSTQFPIDLSVRLRVLVDQRPQHAENGRAPAGRLAGLSRLAGRIIDRWPVVREVPAGEAKRHRFTREVERGVIEYFRGCGGDVVITTRPALNILAARYAPADVVRIAQDHMHLSRYQPGLQKVITKEYGRLDAVVTLTQAGLEEYTGVLEGKVRLARIPNAVPPSGGLVSDQSRKLIVAAGRLTRQKGFDLLIAAFAEVVRRHPDWRLRIFGDGPRAAGLAEMIRGLGLEGRAELRGRTRKLDRELAKASIYVLSSRFEGFPMVILEALGHGLPVVAFDCRTGPAEMITPGTDGLLVPAEDVVGLAEAICRIIEDDRLRRSMGAAAVATAAGYDRTIISAMWEELFTELIANKAAGPAG